MIESNCVQMNGSEKLQTRCVIVGGGPAGMMAGYLLARAGVAVAVLEKHSDFNRDFRGDTIHPSTLELMHEIGLLDEFLKQPHQEVRELRAVVNGQATPVADFRKLPTRCKFIAFMPQWDFLNFLSNHAKCFPTFQLHMETEVVDLLTEDSRVIGVRAKTPQGELEVRADLVVGADGRHSTIQTRAGLDQLEFGVPIDVLWMRISKKHDDPAQSLGFFQQGKLLVLLDRGDYWQAGFVIPKGQFDEIKERGLAQFQNDIVSFAGFLRDRVAELDDWSKIKLLTVQVNRRKVQARREWPTRLIQGMQIFIHRRIVTGRTSDEKKTSLPFVLRLLKWFPILRQLPARFIGLGPRPEHIRSPTAA